jgi:hypothetical protein
MIIISILAFILVTSIILYSLCRVTSKTCEDVRRKSLVFSDTVAMRIGDILSDGDTESVHRILKALQQRGEIELIESEKEIYVCEHRATVADHCLSLFRDLLSADHDPVEDLRHIRAATRFHPDLHLVDPDKGISVREYKPVDIDDLASVADDLFASEYDIDELLGNLSMKPGRIYSCQTPS